MRLRFTIRDLLWLALAAIGPMMVIACHARGQEPTIKSQALAERRVEKLLASDSTSPAGFALTQAYDALFAAAGNDGIQALQRHDSDSIAIQAAWQEVIDSIPEGELKQAVKVDRDKLHWFVGFLEGRGHIRAPQPWAEAVLATGANRRDNTFPSLSWPEKSLYHNIGLDDAQGPLDTTLHRDGKQVLLTIGTESVAIPEELFKHWDSGKISSCVSALFTPQRCYLAIHDDVGYPYQLVSIDRRSEKVVWKSTVWSNWWGGATGIHQTWVWVTVQNNRIVVFGAGTTGTHVEAFRTEDGANLFRFSSSY